MQFMLEVLLIQEFHFFVRILEFEVESVQTHDGRSANVELELWDCSGNHRQVLIHNKDLKIRICR